MLKKNLPFSHYGWVACSIRVHTLLLLFRAYKREKEEKGGLQYRRTLDIPTFPPSFFSPPLFFCAMPPPPENLSLSQTETPFNATSSDQGLARLLDRLLSFLAIRVPVTLLEKIGEYCEILATICMVHFQALCDLN